MSMSFKEKLRENIWSILFFLSIALLASLIILLMIRLSESEYEKEEIIGGVFIGSVDDGGWNENHYNGLLKACEKYGLKLIIEENVKEDAEDGSRAIDALVGQGATAIFLTSDGFDSKIYSTVESWSNVVFYTISPESDPVNMISYYGRMYQMRYLSGMIAGSMTESDLLGYVAGMDNPQVNRGINAYLLGARSVNDDVQVKVRITGNWDDSESEETAAEALIDEGCDILTSHTVTDTTTEVAERNGLGYICYNRTADEYGAHCLANLEFNWDLMYGLALQDFLRGSVKNKHSYWWGVTEGAVNIDCISPDISDELKAKMNEVRKEITQGKEVFLGEIKSNDGTVRCKSNERIGDEALLLDMDWLVEGVEIDVE